MRAAFPNRPKKSWTISVSQHLCCLNLQQTYKIETKIKKKNWSLERKIYRMFTILFLFLLLSTMTFSISCNSCKFFNGNLLLISSKFKSSDFLDSVFKVSFISWISRTTFFKIVSQFLQC